MDLKKYYSDLIITKLELEIKNTKKEIQQSKLTKEINKEYLKKLQDLLQQYYKKYYELNNKE